MDSVMVTADQTDSAVTTPSLWNPTVAAIGSIVFTTAFGSFLLARNEEEMGRIAEARSQERWFYASLCYWVGAVITAILPDPYDSGGVIRGGAHLLLLLAWYFTLGRRHARLVKERFGSRYVHKGWMKPLLVTAAGYAVIFVVTVLLVFITELIR